MCIYFIGDIIVLLCYNFQYEIITRYIAVFCGDRFRLVASVAFDARDNMS